MASRRTMPRRCAGIAWRPTTVSIGAQYQVGVLYEYGRGVSQNFTKAMRWYRRAAAQGLASAQTNIGYLYGAGLGVPKDNAEAMRWYRMGAAQGDALAHFGMGGMDERGLRVRQHYE